MTRGAGWFAPAQRFGEEAFGRRCIAFSRKKEVDRRTGGVDSPV
jgi:hypothetical protein